MNKIILGLLVIMIAIFTTGCGDSGSDNPPAPTVTSIKANASAETIPLGLSVTFTTVSHFSDSSSNDVTTQATYIVQDNTILQESNATNVFKAIGVGSSIVTTQYAGYEVNTTISVSTAELTSISVTAPSLNVGKGESIQFTANGTFTDNSILDISSDVNWTSTDETVGTLSANGLLTTLVIGSTQVSAMKNDIFSNISNVNVNTAVVKSIEITPSSTQVLRLNTIDFTASGVYSDGTTGDITNLVTWSSSDSSLVSITSSGIATGLLEGNTTIIATINSVEKNASIDVIEETLTSITIAIPSEVEEGRTGALSAEGAYDNGTTKDISSFVTWSSLNSSIASVSGSTVTGVGIGSTDIVATLNGQSAQSNINTIKEQWWNYLSVSGGSSSTVSINGYIQAGSWKYFLLNNTSKSSTLRVVKIYGEDGSGNLFLNQTLSDDLSVGTGVGYKVTLSSNQYAPKVCYTIQDTSDSTEHSVCGNW